MARQQEVSRRVVALLCSFVLFKRALCPSSTHLSHNGARHGLTHLCVCVALWLTWSVPVPETAKVERAPVRVRASESELDAALQRAATAALGEREGAIIVSDAQTGRVRAIINRRLAEAGAFPPGSAIKPFTLLAALRARVIDANARLSCRKHYARNGANFTCSHPVYNPPFTSAQALAHSCNYYFARLAERLPHEEFNDTLAAYGFGARATTLAAKAVDARPLMPKLPRGRWQLATALGEGEELLVSPAQLIAAYAALFNGGHLYRMQIAAPEHFRPQEIARLAVSPEHRAMLLEGLRGAVKYGTAAPADLASLPNHVFGKTGTATELDGLHTHGWFVGLASERESNSDATHAHVQADDSTDEPASAQVKLAVLVFLKRGQGKQSAELARAVFAEHARVTTTGDDTTSTVHEHPASSTRRTDAEGFADSSREAHNSTLVRVHLAREEATRAMPLDDYLFGVLAAEASVEDEFAALKAQAVVSRTYALGNLRRHARNHYDFCNTTHCQRFLQVTGENARPDFHDLVRRAVNETTGEVLRDARGNLARDVYFSTSCGGQTANLHTLWGTPAREPYQRGVRDEYCAAMPHHHWTDAIPATQLARALREDARTDVGTRVAQLSIVKRDATGRVAQIAMMGEQGRRVVRGWDFKIIVGRTLGWSVLKSSRFEVVRTGDKFVFRGSGFGHGLGLCQNGAHVMAARGVSYRQILAYYFPGTTIGGTAETKNAARQDQAARLTAKAHENGAVRNEVYQAASFAHAGSAHVNFAHANFTPSLASPRLTLSSENFRVSYPARGASNARREVESALAALEAVRADVRGRLASASIAMPALGVLEVFVHETTGDFVGATGQPAWVAATTHHRRIDLPPLATLRRRGILVPTLRHEYAHAVIDALARGRAPLWLIEGLAAHVAGEGAMLTRFESKQKLSPEELDKRLAQPASAAEMRALYAAAFRAVNALIRAEGEAHVWRRVARG